MCSNPGGGGAKNGSATRGNGLDAPAPPPAPLDPADDAVLRGAGSLIPLILNCFTENIQ